MRHVFAWLLGMIVLCAKTITVENSESLHLALKEACNNGQDDTIVLESGTYDTSDSSIGTFTYDGLDGRDLTIESAEGLEYSDVTLTGTTGRILRLKSSASVTFTLKRLTISGGILSDGNGSGVLSDHKLILQQCRLTNNRTYYYGGGAFSAKLTLYDSIISGNGANYENITDTSIHGGGGVYASEELQAFDTSFSDNTAYRGYGGGAWGKSIFLDGCTFWDNLASNAHGGGAYGEKIIAVNSEFFRNEALSAGHGGALYANSFYLYNATLWNNKSALLSGGAYGKAVAVVNTLLYNDDYDLYLTGSGNSYFYNNYLSYVKLKNIDNNSSQSIYLSDNVQILATDGITQASLPVYSASAPFVDKGINPQDASFSSLMSGLTTSEKTLVTTALLSDREGNERVHNTTIDMGPEEFDAPAWSADPKVSDITPGGELKSGKTVSFTFSYTLATDRTLGSLSFDCGDGLFTTITSAAASCVFADAGSYKVRARVEDSLGGIGIGEKTITIDVLIDDAVRSYCQGSPQDCFPAGTVIYTEAQCRPSFSGLSSGWHLKGTGVDMSSSYLGTAYLQAWTYRAGEWINNPAYYDSGEGFWIKMP